MSKRKKKYFPNNWKAYKDSPDDFFIPMEYDYFFNWKVHGWELPSSVSCIIREEDLITGKISERVYSRRADAQKRLAKQMSTDKPYSFVICDDESCHILEPGNLSEDYEDED